MIICMITYWLWSLNESHIMSVFKQRSQWISIDHGITLILVDSTCALKAHNWDDLPYPYSDLSSGMVLATRS